MERNAAVLAKALRAWEMDAGESFTDYYLSGAVKPVSWAFWLLGKGFVGKANPLITRINNGERYIDQDEMFHVFYDPDRQSWDDWDHADRIYFKDFKLWAEFLTASDRYFDDICAWLKDKYDDCVEAGWNKDQIEWWKE